MVLAVSLKEGEPFCIVDEKPSVAALPGWTFSADSPFEVPIHVTEPLAGKELVFKLGFMPSKKAQAIPKENKPMGIYWSNEIKIEVGE